MTIVDERETSKKNIDDALNLIYNLGDKDECSDKHLGHCLAAITSGKTHREAVAYAYPWHSGKWDEEGGLSNEAWDIDERKIALEKYWQVIETEYFNNGQTDFQEIVEELQEPYYSDCLVYYFPTGESDPRGVAPPPPLESSPPISAEQESPTGSCPTTTSQILGIMI